MAGAAPADGEIGLADVIRQVRADLQAAQRESEESGSELRFAVDRVSLEIAVQVRREGSGRAGLRIGVVTADLGGGVSRDTTHRIQVDLLPRHPDGSYQVGGEAGELDGGLDGGLGGDLDGSLGGDPAGESDATPGGAPGPPGAP